MRLHWARLFKVDSISRLFRLQLCRRSHAVLAESKGQNTVRVRFAPSPTGQLHLGGLRTAIYNYLFCRSQNGKFILRIEDTDQARLVPGAVEKLIDMLDWAGVKIDEGVHCGGSYGPYVQSQRLSLYSEAIQKLLKNGTAYHCFCSEKRLELLRKQTVACGETPKYDNRCRHLSAAAVDEKLAAHTPHVIRFKLMHHVEPWIDLVYGPITYDVANIEGDPVLIKSDGYPTYHFANVVDDHYMNISHVLRGVEWQVSTTKHILLYKAFDWLPPQYAHLPLLQNKDGKKLSKRQNDVNVEHYKNLGYFPEAVVNLLTNMGSGFSVRDTSGMTMQQLIQHFDLSKLNTNSTRVDFDKLTELNKCHLKRIMGGDETARRLSIIRDVRDKVDIKHQSSSSSSSLVEDCLLDDYIERVINWSRERIGMANDLLAPEFEFLWLRPATPFNLALFKDVTLSIAQDIILSTSNGLQSIDASSFTKESIAAVVNGVGRHSKLWSYKTCMHLLRFAVTGHQEGPSVVEIMSLLGKKTTLLRLKEAQDKICKDAMELSKEKHDRTLDLLKSAK